MSFIIPKSLSQKVVMTGVEYRNNHPGGISAVVQYWSKYIERLQFYPTFKEGSKTAKLLLFGSSYIRLGLRLLFDRKVEIVHVHTAAGSDFKRSAMIVELAKRFNKKVILHSHASQFKVYYSKEDNTTQQWIVNTLRKVDVLIALSESWKEWFTQIGVNPRKITILHNVTAYPQVMNPNRNAQSPVRFLFLGEIGQRKGVFDVIRALTIHKADLEGKIVLRIGGNKNEEQLLSAIKAGGLDKMVRFEGFAIGDKKIELLNWADVYILPSFNEGLPISILEAMSYSMPIIATPVGGIPEVVDKKNGIMVAPGNEEEIFNAMKFYAENIDQIKQQGKESYKKVETYLPDYVLNHLKQIYESLIKIQ